MSKQTKWNRWLLGAIAVLVLALATAAVYPQVTQAAGNDPGLPGPRGWNDGPRADHDALLAEALGISSADLQAAREEAATAAIEQAVQEGLITQEQADRLQERGAGHFFGFGRFASDTIDPQALLAQALDISVDELQAAQQSARAAALDQAVADGRITQEQADLIQARQALQTYLKERMQNAYEEAVQQAVQDGVITQEQADQILSSGPGFFGPENHGGFHGRMGPGGFHGRRGPGGFRGQPDETVPQSNGGRIAPAGTNL